MHFVTSPLPLTIMRCPGITDPSARTDPPCEWLNFPGSKFRSSLAGFHPKIGATYEKAMAIRGGGEGLVFGDRWLFVGCHVTRKGGRHFPELVRVDLRTWEMARSRPTLAEFQKLRPEEMEGSELWRKWGVDASDEVGIFDPTGLFLREHAGAGLKGEGDKTVELFMSACVTSKAWVKLEPDDVCNGVYKVDSALLPTEWGGQFVAPQ